MSDRLPLPLRLYRFASFAATPAMPRLLAWRLSHGKEDVSRLGERRGEATRPRPAGPLIWVHGASVGEMLTAIPLMENLAAQDFGLLVTSGTVGAAKVAGQRLPPSALHQFIPLDTPRYVSRFVSYWRPDLALFVESELWPNLILGLAERKVPMISINGRVSQRSFGRWRFLPATIAAMLSRFDLCLAQSEDDAQRYRQLGAPRVVITGNLKLDAPAPPVDDRALRQLKIAIGLRDVLVAASTHPDEEATLIACHRRLRIKSPSLLTVIAPRHPERGTSIAELAKSAGLKMALRSRGGLPNRDVDIYIADTLGELGLIYRLGPVVFMGGSLARHGGQNPIEAIRFGAAIAHGPHTWNFSEIYPALDQAGGAKLVVDEESLAACLQEWLCNPASRSAVANAAKTIVEQRGGALGRTLAALDPYLMQLRLEQRAS